ncbi:MAG: NAD(P)H-hydrate dehydratase [Gallionellaceae bacterium]|nr:NAD(P)H-hydrate dehydratase [Gallionellaceae bacterium]
MHMQRTLDPDEIKAWLKPRPRDSHKGDYGNVGIIGGAPGMAGAALLAGRAALLLGAGRVHVGLLDDRLAVDFEAPELMLTTPDRVLGLASPGCLVIGPGLGLAAAARGWLEPALATALPLLLDADALNQIAADPTLADRVRQRRAATLLTPHPGEAGRLLGRSGSEVQADRPGALRELVQRYGAGVLLKGADSLIGFPGRPIWRNTTGNPGMAAPGMGDVLAGMIAALAARGLEIEQAAVVAAHLHGAAGDHAVGTGLGPDGLAASEVARAARTLLNELIYRVP